MISSKVSFLFTFIYYITLKEIILKMTEEEYKKRKLIIYTKYIPEKEEFEKSLEILDTEDKGDEYAKFENEQIHFQYPQLGSLMAINIYKLREILIKYYEDNFFISNYPKNQDKSD
jgi:hypothetical protein